MLGKLKEENLKNYLIVGDCWEYQGPLNLGYGVFYHKNKWYKMHRISFEHFKGPISRGYMICHKCNNKKCFNPDHLYMGTDKENKVDRLKFLLKTCDYKDTSQISARIEKEKRIKVIEKCIYLNITISEYINSLIDKDLEKNKLEEK